MLEVLVASRPRRQSAPWQFAGSGFIHFVMLGLCILAGRTTVVVISRPVADTTLVFLPRLDPAIVDKPVTRVGRGGGDAENEGSGGIVLSANPPPLGFQAVDVVRDVPTFIPSVAPGERILDPRDFTGRGVEGGTGWGVVGGTGPADQEPIEGDGRELLYGASKERRFAAAVLTVEPAFVYPRVLRDASIGGRVLLQFVIDTLGRVEPASIEVLETADPAFSESARSGVLGAQFRPAYYGDRPVRQRTRMPVSFRMAGPEA